jgi:hypothetical protein
VIPFAEVRRVEARGGTLLLDHSGTAAEFELGPQAAKWAEKIKKPRSRESMAAGKAAGLVDVKVVSFSETHTAEKFVVPVAKR